MTPANLLTQLDAIDAFTSRMRHGEDAAYLSHGDVLALFRAIGASRAVRRALEELTDIEVTAGWPDTVVVEFADRGEIVAASERCAS